MRHLILALLWTAALLPAQKLKPGSWDKKDCPDDWVIVDSKNYQIQSQCGEDKGRRLATHMESMLSVYRQMFRSNKTEFKKYPVKLFADRGAFVSYGQTPGAAAYYSASDGEMVCYDTGKWQDEAPQGPITGPATGRPRVNPRDLFTMDLLGCAAHEGWHQYFHWYVTSWVALPSWINEGMGDYFYSAIPKVVDGKRKGAELGRMNLPRLGIIKAALRQGRTVPLAEFINYKQPEYYANPSICYAQGWALCQFLLHSDNKKYNAILPEYIKRVRDTSLVDKVTQVVFKGIDLEKLEKEFLAWVKQVPYTAEEEEDLDGEGEGEGEGNGAGKAPVGEGGEGGGPGSEPPAGEPRRGGEGGQGGGTGRNG